MAIPRYGVPPGLDVQPRTTLEESPSMSKAVRRYGVNGARLDSTYGSTGGHEVHESDIAPSIGAKHVGHIGPARREVVGHDPDSGKWRSPTHDRDLIGNAVETHPPLKPEGQGWSANASRGGKQSKVPAKTPPSTTRADAGALAGEPKARTAYQGGKGPVR
jgi:hypothetical protein